MMTMVMAVAGQFYSFDVHDDDDLVDGLKQGLIVVVCSLTLKTPTQHLDG
jgi:hypothetical protein